MQTTFSLESNTYKVSGVLGTKFGGTRYISWAGISVDGHSDKSIRLNNLSQRVITDLTKIVIDSILGYSRDVSRFNDIARKLDQ